jgi:hypothetical protein
MVWISGPGGLHRSRIQPLALLFSVPASSVGLQQEFYLAVLGPHQI